MTQTSAPSTRVDPALPIASIVAEAYAVFDGPPPKTLDVCTACCMSLDTEREMLRTASRDLTQHQIWEWYNSALFNGPTVPKDVWTFLLPRVLEIIASNEDAHNGLGPVASFDRFPHGDRSQWTDREWDLLTRYRVALIDMCKVPDLLTCDTLLGYIEGFVAGGFDLEPIVAQLKTWPKADLVARLTSDWGGHLGIYWWSPQALAILNRLCRDDFLDPLVAYAFDEPDQTKGEMALRVSELLLDHAQGRA